MTVTALVSGGKDSIYSAYLSETQGWTVDELLTLQPEDPESMLFHTPNLWIVGLQAEAWGRSHRTVTIAGRGEAAETQALGRALANDHGTVVAGAIGSSFQWARLHQVCYRLGRRLYTPLWGKDPERVVREEIGAGLDIRLIHLAADRLSADLLGKRLDRSLLQALIERNRTLPPINVAGEGGEFETLVVDAPFFQHRIALEDPEVVLQRDVSRLRVRKARLAAKRSER